MGFVKKAGQGLGLIQNDAPSAEETLALQAKANGQQQQTNLQQNRVNQVGPDGTSSWTQGPKGPNGEPGQWTQTTALSAGNQKLYDTQQELSQGLANTSAAALGRVQSTLGQPMDMNGMPARANGPDASQFQTGQVTSTPVQAAQAEFTASGPAASYGGAGASAGRNIQRTFDSSNVRALPGQIDDTSRRRVEEALMSRLNPQLQQDESALRTRLLNSGIEVGTDAYNREMNNFGQKQNDARMQTILAGGQEENRQVGLTQGLNAQEFGQSQAKGDYAQRADAQMAGNETSASIASANNATQAGVASMNAANQASLFNASQKNDMGKYNAGLVNDMEQSNTKANLQTADLNRQITGQNYQTGLAGANFQNANRNDAMKEALTLRQQPLAELNALRTGSQPGTPQFGNYFTNAMTPGNAQAAQNEATKQANAQQSQFGSFFKTAANIFMPTFGP